jgi:hypothetical protein
MFKLFVYISDEDKLKLSVLKLIILTFVSFNVSAEKELPTPETK